MMEMETGQDKEQDREQDKEQCHHTECHSHGSGNYSMALLVLAVVMVALTQFQIYQLSTMVPGGGFHGTGLLSAFSGISGSSGKNVILGPALKPDGKIGISEFPTISEMPNPKATGDPAQDALNRYVPTGMPWYGAEVGVNFDDPVGSLDRWARYDGGIDGRRFNTPGVTIKETDLSPAAKARYDKLINLFTCDFCCGSPNNPTRIGNCGCAHSAAWRGIFKYFLKNHEDKFNDEQLMGEATRWKLLWYPGPSIKRILTEGGSAEQVSLDSLPSMVGGC